MLAQAERPGCYRIRPYHVWYNKCRTWCLQVHNSEHDPFPQPPTSIGRDLEEDKGSQDNPQLQWIHAVENRSNTRFNTTYVMLSIVHTGVFIPLALPVQPTADTKMRRTEGCGARFTHHSQQGGTLFF